MRRGTTPTLVLAVTGLNVAELDTIFITFEQGSLELTKSKDDITIDEEANTIKVTLSQEETLKFNAGSVNVQVRGIVADGSIAVASNIKTIKVGNVLLDGVIVPRNEE